MSGSECMVPDEDGHKCFSVDPWIFGRSLERERKTHAYEGSAVAGRDSLTPAMRFRSSALPKSVFPSCDWVFFPRAPRSMVREGRHP